MQLKNFKVFLNHLLKNKLYTAVTVLGFAFSLTFIILLSVYIRKELSVNSLQKNKERIYRLVNEKFGMYAPPVGNWLQNEFPEIECYTRTYGGNGYLAAPDNSKIKFDYLLADSAFFKMFTFRLIEGDPETALKTKNSIVLSEAFARKLFGNRSPLGKQLVVNSGHTCVVTGVVEDISMVSNFSRCDAILNFNILGDFWNYPQVLTELGNCSFGLYLMAGPNADLPSKSGQILELFKKDFWIYKEGMVKKVILEPLTDVYFSTIPGRVTEHNSKTHIVVLLAIVILILILSIINYMNLTIARSGMRIKEIAVKKLMGSSRAMLIRQHIYESVFLCFIAFFLAMVFGFLAEPAFNRLLDTQLNLQTQIYGAFMLLLIGVVVLVGFLAGIVPAMVITGLKAVDVLKGGFRRKSKTIYSKILIGFQYAVVIALLIATIIISKQTAFMQNYNPGFNTQNIFYLDNELLPQQYNGFKNELMNIPGVKNVSFVAGTPIDGGNNNSFKYHEKLVSFQVFVVDSAFFDLMQINITPTGTAYSKDGIYLNRTGVKVLELDSLPKSFKRDEETIPVLGVTDDFNFKSLHQKIGPVMIRQRDTSDYAWSILVGLEGGNIVSTVDKVKAVYSEFTDGVPFDYGFFDQTIKNWYEKEKKTARIVSYFALLSIVISVMGIFAMSIFYNQQKTKEIGIRKVNGATVSEIILLLNRDFVRWVAAAFVVAAPVAWYVMERWLENFAYKIELTWWIFVLSGIAAFAIALLTVSWQTLLAARRNPVESLRYE